MRLHGFILAATLTSTSVPGVMDFSTVTCHAFLASGSRNMAATFMFLHGYHAGKTGVVAYPSNSSYAARLGKYCRDHPRANLIEASEQILSELDSGI
jgi:hypothetical protein